MNSTISIEDKKVFIKWLLKNKKMKRRECVWMLNYILTHDEILENVRFMEEAHYCQRAIVMSTTEAESIPFRFYQGNLMTADAEKAFHDMRMFPDKELCIQINFLDKYGSAEYLAVMEENKYIPEHLKKETVKISEEIPEDIERLVSEITVTNSRASLMNEIDKALDNGDEELFMQLSGMLIGQEESKEVTFSA